MKRKCIICNKEFKTKSNRQKCCSNQCIKFRKQETNKKYRESHKEYAKKYRKNYYQKNKEKESRKCKEYQIKNKEQLKVYKHKYAKEHREERKKYELKNKIRIRKYRKKYCKNRRETDINFKLAGNLRNHVYQAIKHDYKNSSILQLLGCTISELKQHLENKFTKDMTWTNYGKYWEIDHIIPIFSFNFAEKSEQRECFHYTNLRPLTIKENRSRKRK